MPAPERQARRKLESALKKLQGATMEGMMTRTTLLAVVLLVAWGQAAQAADKKLALVERATSDAVTDLGAKGDSAGDILTFANPIYDAKNEKQLGTNNGWCMRTVPGKAWECFWTLSLEEGQVMVEGPFLDGEDSLLAVTGGTGKYASVRGEMKLHARDEKGTEYDFVYMLR
jgi:allene oxide cyclase